MRPDAPKELTWEDIIADDPLEGEIWEDVDFGAESSDEWSDDGYTRPRSRDEFVESLRSEANRRRKTLSIADGETAYNVSGAEGFTVQGDEKGLESLKKAQYWIEKVLPIEREVDVSLASCGGITSRVTNYHSTLHILQFDMGGGKNLLTQRVWYSQ